MDHLRNSNDGAIKKYLSLSSIKIFLCIIFYLQRIVPNLS